MQKAKAYKFHAQEIKQANREATRQLDEDWNDVAGLLNFDRVAKVDHRLRAKDDKANGTDVFDTVLTQLKTEGVQRVEPIKPLTEKDKAVSRREQLERMQKMTE